ncbi:hypothetical protein OPV22_024649 [Ensete ventricosum]|uniref:Uncharacterized protein n=1 Tax=Ensete ventricosum TaxID=4639 RepID=A0AAV8P8V0_ENSVE|nr:hypothetical protein OPV22_024649 [Ensete ventricosum]
MEDLEGEVRTRRMGPGTTRGGGLGLGFAGERIEIGRGKGTFVDAGAVDSPIRKAAVGGGVARKRRVGVKRRRSTGRRIGSSPQLHLIEEVLRSGHERMRVQEFPLVALLRRRRIALKLLISMIDSTKTTNWNHRPRCISHLSKQARSQQQKAHRRRSAETA